MTFFLKVSKALLIGLFTGSGKNLVNQSSHLLSFCFTPLSFCVISSFFGGGTYCVG